MRGLPTSRESRGVEAGRGFCRLSPVVKKILKWIPALIIVCVSWYLSGMPKIRHLPTFRNADKVIHFLCFGALSFWVAFACNIKTYKKIWLPTLIVSVYGIIDEIHQCFTPGRSCSVLDWCADTVGAVVGAVLFVFVIKKIILLFSDLA
ncbi:MAG: VanZ family protein [Treponema sp.]|nr:VanZ family protein [Treponema sp.]